MLDAAPETDSLERLLDAAEALSGLPLRRIAAEGTPEEISDTRAAQPLLYLADWAWGTALLDAGLEPCALAGHSLGELASLAVANVYSVEAGLELVVERSKLMAAAAEANPGGMAAVLGLETSAISGALEGIDGVWLANDNSPGQVVISGTVDALGPATDALTAAGARRIVPLAVAGAFHSPLMASAGAAFEQILAETDFSDAALPIVQNSSPSPATEAATVKERLAAQITSPVRWTETMVALGEGAPVILIEAGPGAVLTGLAKRFDDIDALAVEQAGIEGILEGVDIDG